MRLARVSGCLAEPNTRLCARSHAHAAAPRRTQLQIMLGAPQSQFAADLSTRDRAGYVVPVSTAPLGGWIEREFNGHASAEPRNVGHHQQVDRATKRRVIIRERIVWHEIQVAWKERTCLALRRCDNYVELARGCQCLGRPEHVRDFG